MQGVIGVDKKKSFIHIAKSSDEKAIHVYIGFALFETIPNDPASFSFRYLVARLAKSGFSFSAIATAFDLDWRTVKRYRDILATSQSDQMLFDRLIGYHHKNTKITSEVEAYILARFRRIYPNNRKDYNQQLRKEVQQEFGATLSPEALRRLIAPIRKELKAPVSVQKVCEPANAQTAATSSAVAMAKPSTTCSSNDADDFYSVTSPLALAETSEIHEVETPTNNFYHCAGLLVFNLWVQEFVTQLRVEAFPLLQWLYQILYGVVNFEQVRYFPRHEIEVFIASKTIGVTQSRHHLWTMAHEDFEHYVEALSEVNLNFVSKPQGDRQTIYYYLDGHFDPYFGKLEILKGWSCLMNRALKGTMHYVLHDDQGYAVLTALKDCFDDFRDYIKTTLPRLQSFVRLVPELRAGLVYDRGGFSEELFEEHEKTQTHFITWEKGFKVRDKNEFTFNGSLTLYQEQNNVGNFRTVEIAFFETTYQSSLGYKCRKFIIKRHDDEKPMYASILSNDQKTDAATLITYMLKRWACQENDFKYEKAHFGLDEITSYASEQLSLQDGIQEQKGKVKALEKEIDELQEERQKLLEQLGVKRLTQKKIAQIHQTAIEENNKGFQILQQYEQVNLKLAKAKKQHTKKQKAITRMEKIESNGYIRLDLRQKQILDQLKIIARNIFYKVIEEFQKSYKNLRDIHVVLRKLTQSCGVVIFFKNEIQVHLECSFTGNAATAVTQFIDTLNARSPKMLDGSERKIRFHLHN
jgi:hypothetical protein